MNEGDFEDENRSPKTEREVHSPLNGGRREEASADLQSDTGFEGDGSQEGHQGHAPDAGSTSSDLRERESLLCAEHAQPTDPAAAAYAASADAESELRSTEDRIVAHLEPLALQSWFYQNPIIRAELVKQVLEGASASDVAVEWLCENFDSPTEQFRLPGLDELHPSTLIESVKLDCIAQIELNLSGKALRFWQQQNTQFRIEYVAYTKLGYTPRDIARRYIEDYDWDWNDLKPIMEVQCQE